MTIDIPERQAEVGAIHAEIFAERRAKREAKPPLGPVMPSSLEDAALLDKARKAKDGARFMALYDRGDWRAEGFPSQSEADLWLTGKLAFWGGHDAARIDAFFRRSALMRGKWDDQRGVQTYGHRTIARAIAGCAQVYTQRRRGQEKLPPRMSEQNKTCSRFR